MPQDEFSGLTLVVPPAAEPVTVADAKAHSRIFTSADDSLIAGYISAARMRCEHITKRAFMPQTWRYSLKNFPGRNYASGPQQLSNLQEYDRWSYIEIPLPPLQNITSFEYIDTGGNQFFMQQGYTNLVGNYLLDTEAEPGRACLPFAGIWPVTVLLPRNASPIRITFQCGYPSYSGTVDIDGNGGVAWDSGTQFDAFMTGTWISIGGLSYNVASVIDPQHIQLASPIASNQYVATLQSTTPLPYTANAVPMPIRQANLLLAAHLYENRETVITGRSVTAVEIPQTVDDMLSAYRVRFM